jgi:hypothetical protein
LFEPVEYQADRISLIFMLTQAFWTSLRIIAFRAGPEDLPYDPGRQLTGSCVAFALLANAVMASTVVATSGMKLSAPLLDTLLLAVATVLALGVCTRVVLRTRQLDNRFQQTFNALLLTSSILTLAVALPMHLLEPLEPQIQDYLTKLQAHPELLNDPSAAPLFPGWAMLLTLLASWLLLWQFAVTIFIYRRAANTRTGGGIFIALLCVLTVKSFQTLFSALIH